MRSCSSSARGSPRSSPARLLFPALLIGVLYGCLYLFGTGIYLDRRENTYCIPLNRCSSLLSGIFAAFGLTLLVGLRPPSGYQLIAACIILTALAILMASTLQGYRRAARGLAQRMILFVCAGNTSRSPMAQALCNDEILRRVGIPRERLDQVPGLGHECRLDCPARQSVFGGIADHAEYLGVVRS